MDYSRLPVTMTVDQVAQELQIGRRGVYALIASGRLYAIYLTKRCIRIPREAFLLFLGVAEESVPDQKPLMKIIKEGQINN